MTADLAGAGAMGGLEKGLRCQGVAASKRRHSGDAWSARVIEVALRFGLSLAPSACLTARCDEDAPPPGSITLVAGPSGSGKTTLLRSMSQRWPAARWMHLYPVPLDVPVLDAVAPTRSIDEALGLLTACGLGEPAVWLRRFDQLSAGEQFRVRLARAISLHARVCGNAPRLCDEFASGLHERLARAIAFNLRKLASRWRLALVVATAREDVAEDLSPERVVRTSPASAGEAARSGARGWPSFAAGLCVEPGELAEYARFASMHYRGPDRIGVVDRVFVLRDAAGGEALGVVVYGRGALELRTRNRATGGRFAGHPGLLNEELRVLKRLVIHPDVRGCGLGHWLVRETLPRAGARFVECLAAMGLVNPVFEKAGMERIGVCESSAGTRRALARLAAMDVEPLSPDLAEALRANACAREVVVRVVGDWYRGRTADGEARARRLEPEVLARTFRQLAGSRPVYYLWARDEAGWEVVRQGMSGET